MKILSKFTVLGLITLSLMSCKKDEVDNPLVAEGNILISAAVPSGNS